MVSFVPPAPPGAHQHPPTGSGAEPGLVHHPADDLDVVGGGVRSRVTRTQHQRRALTPPVAGAVVEPCGQVGGSRTPF